MFSSGLALHRCPWKVDIRPSGCAGEVPLLCMREVSAQDASKPHLCVVTMHDANRAAVAPWGQLEELIKTGFGCYPLAHATYHILCTVLWLFFVASGLPHFQRHFLHTPASFWIHLESSMGSISLWGIHFLWLRDRGQAGKGCMSFTPFMLAAAPERCAAAQWGEHGVCPCSSLLHQGQEENSIANSHGSCFASFKSSYYYLDYKEGEANVC